MVKSVIFFVFGFSALLSAVVALECYVCSDCENPFEITDDKTKMDCGEGSCMKINVTLKATVIVSRGCALEKVEEEKCTRNEEVGSVTEKCYCNGDSCNTATHITMTSSLFVIRSVLLFLTTAVLAQVCC